MKRRKQNLVRNDVQLGTTLTHVGLALMAVVFQFLAFLYTMTGRGAAAEGGGATDPAILAGLVQALLVTLLVVLPLTLVAGILTTHRLAGPIMQFERFLERLARGEAPEDLQLRRGDKLQSLCGLLNDVTRPLRGGERTAVEEHAPEDVDQAA